MADKKKEKEEKPLDEDVEEEEETEEDEDIAEPGADDLSADADDDDSFLANDDGDEDEDEKPAKSSARPRRRAPVRPGTIGGVARSRLDKPDHAKKAWDELNLQAASMPEDEIGEPVPYDMHAIYEKGARVEHTKFGLGHVVEIVSPKKVEVLFEDALRKLVQNR